MRDSASMAIHVELSVEKYLRDLRLVRHEFKTSGNFIFSIASPVKAKPTLEASVFDFRAYLYAKTYRHSTGVKLEFHLVKALGLLGSEIGQMRRRARVDGDWFNAGNYALLTDGYCETKIRENVKARKYWEATVVRRKLMRQISEVELEGHGKDLRTLKSSMVAAAITNMQVHSSTKSFLETLLHENLHLVVDKYHRGNKAEDPSALLVWYDSKGKKEDSGVLGRDLVAQILKKVHMVKRVRAFFEAPLTWREAPGEEGTFESVMDPDMLDKAMWGLHIGMSAWTESKSLPVMFRRG